MDGAGGMVPVTTVAGVVLGDILVAGVVLGDILVAGVIPGTTGMVILILWHLLQELPNSLRPSCPNRGGEIFAKRVEEA
jgi:hypothetical protein